MNFCYESYPRCRIDCATCWPAVQRATTVLRTPPPHERYMCYCKLFDPTVLHATKTWGQYENYELVSRKITTIILNTYPLFGQLLQQRSVKSSIRTENAEIIITQLNSGMGEQSLVSIQLVKREKQLISSMVS